MQTSSIYFAVLLIASSVAIDLPAFAEDQSISGQAGEVKERAVPAPPPYHCGQGVCLCLGQANCDQLTQPTPCKRQKFCVGQTASPPPPLPPQEPALSQQKVQSTARTTTGNIVICSCRSGQ
jgi:hypothetical protein